MAIIVWGQHNWGLAECPAAHGLRPRERGIEAWCIITIQPTNSQPYSKKMGFNTCEIRVFFIELDKNIFFKEVHSWAMVVLKILKIKLKF